jgi:Transposase, Mutator family
MPTRALHMRKIRELIRLKHEARLLHEQIAGALAISKGVVAKYVARIERTGLEPAVLVSMSDAEVMARIAPASRRPNYGRRVTPDFAHLHAELKRPNMTLMLLWQEYSAANAGGLTYRYSQFAELYRQDSRRCVGPCARCTAPSRSCSSIMPTRRSATGARGTEHRSSSPSPPSGAAIGCMLCPSLPTSRRCAGCSTNSIESLTAKLRRSVRIRGHFPNDEAAMKLIWLQLREITKNSKMPPCEWSAAKAQFAVVFGDRFEVNR